MSHVLSSNVNGVISSPHWEVWTMGIGAGGGGAQMQDGLHQANPNLAELGPLAPRPCRCPGPLSSPGPFLGHRGPPAPDLCGLPGNPRGSLSAHEFRGTRGAAGSRPPTARLLLPPAASARAPGLRSSVTANCGRALRGCHTRPGPGAARRDAHARGFRASFHSANGGPERFASRGAPSTGLSLPREGGGCPVPWLSPGPTEKLTQRRGGGPFVPLPDVPPGLSADGFRPNLQTFPAPSRPSRGKGLAGRVVLLTAARKCSC